MATLTQPSVQTDRPVLRRADRPSYAAFRILQVGFVTAPAIAGIDKFFDALVNWQIYLSPMVSRMVDAQIFMRTVGVIEIAAALLVAFKPRLGGLVVAFWMWGIIINLLSIPGYYDIALRDLGLSLGALALASLATEYSPD
jgi:hypothetical protein